MKLPLILLKKAILWNFKIQINKKKYKNEWDLIIRMALLYTMLELNSLYKKLSDWSDQMNTTLYASQSGLKIKSLYK